MSNMRSRKNSRAPARRNVSVAPSHPPKIDALQLKQSKRLRFVTNAAVTATITFADILDTLVFAASATALWDVFYAVRIRRIQLWATPVVGGATSVSCQFTGTTLGANGDQAYHSDTSMGIQPAHVSCRPPKGSAVGLWQTSSSAQAVFITGPSGMVVDIEVDFTSNNGQVAAQNNGSGLTTGRIYWRGLDGEAISTTQFVPVTPTSAGAA